MDIHSLKKTMLLCGLLLAAGIFCVAFLRIRGSFTKRICVSVLVVIASGGFVYGVYKGLLADTPIVQRLLGRKSLDEQLQTYGPIARPRLKELFAAAGVDYPPRKLVWIGLKQEKQLEVYAGGSDDKMHLVHSYEIFGLSGHAGPKLALGDNQVPEGVYRIEAFQPSTPYHLALRVNYPNEFDRRRAAEDGRAWLGSDIMIHGNVSSAGCLAMGDVAAEDLFVMAADTGLNNIEILLLPFDFRKVAVPVVKEPKWLAPLYADLEKEVSKYQ